FIEWQRQGIGEMEDQHTLSKCGRRGIVIEHFQVLDPIDRLRITFTGLSLDEAESERVTASILSIHVSPYSKIIVLTSAASAPRTATQCERRPPRSAAAFGGSDS